LRRQRSVSRAHPHDGKTSRQHALVPLRHE
jgi:hypothetical protein